MKSLHPTAVVVNPKGERTHYMLRRIAAEELAKPNSNPEERLIIATWDDFTKAVKAGEVQLFEDGPNGPEVKYSEDELRRLSKLSKKMTLTTGEQYYHSEVTFKDRLIADPKALSFSLVSMQIQAFTNVRVITGAVYFQSIQPANAAFLKQSCAWIKPMTGDLWVFTSIMEQFLTLLRDMDLPMSISTAPMTYVDNSAYGVKSFGFKVPAPVVIRDTVEELENIDKLMKQKYPGRGATASTTGPKPVGFNRMSLG